MARKTQRAQRVEPRIWLEHGSYAIQVYVDGRPVRRAIGGTLAEARAALRRFDETGELPARKRPRHGNQWSKMTEPAESLFNPPDPPGERKQGPPMDHLQAARTVLHTSKVQLEAELRQIDAALAALGDEEDASARFRTPGSAAGNVSDEVRRQVQGSVERVDDNGADSKQDSARGPRKSTAETAIIRSALLEIMQPDGDGIAVRDMQVRLAEIGHSDVTKSALSRYLRTLREAGLARLYQPPGGNPSDTVWYRTSSQSEPAPATLDGPTPAS